MTSVTDTITKEVEQVKDEINVVADEDIDSIDTNARYMAYGSRIQTALRASTRYIAYTSDIGEAFRPVVVPKIVTAGYAVSWLYLTGDVAYEAYKAYRQGPTPEEAANFSEPTRVGMLAVKRSVFQAVASMGLPAFTIHTIVKRSARLFANTKNPRVKLWGPTFAGLAVVPVLPYLFDHPVEHATDKVFGWIEEAWIASKHREEELKVRKEL